MLRPPPIPTVPALALTLALSLGPWGCGGEAPPDEGTAPADTLPTVRPAARFGADGGLVLELTGPERPVAYLSRAERRVWVERGLRDRIHRILGAHISVSTGLWRIPLPGDDPRVPIAPGDEAREYLETPMESWDAELEPAEGDVRVFQGTGVEARAVVDCRRVAGVVGTRAGDRPGKETTDEAGRWLSAGPWTAVLVRPRGRELHGETFREVGPGRLHAEAGCPGPGRAVTLRGWATDPASSSP